LIGFSIFNPLAKETAELILGIAKAMASKIGLSLDEITRGDFEIDSSYLGGAYGHLDNLTSDSIKELARLEGILTDPVYTGKAFTGMLHNARSGQFNGKNVLFCHTGGQAALSAYPQLR
jgi:1-aminocyclopropane-1-carboxylate deaminase